MAENDSLMFRFSMPLTGFIEATAREFGLKGTTAVTALIYLGRELIEQTRENGEITISYHSIDNFMRGRNTKRRRARRSLWRRG